MDAATVQKIVEAINRPQIVELGLEQKVALVPSGMTLIDIAKMMPPPARIRQGVRALTVKSFLDYVNLFKNDNTTVFANESTGKYEAVIDYHVATALGGASPRGTSEHIVDYECPLSDQWKAWTGKSGFWFQQIEFAEFLELNLREIVSPPGATFLQVALDLQIHKAAEFQSEVNLDNGQTKFRYEETVRGTKKAGDIGIPSEFSLALPVFLDGVVHKVDARFRYRMAEGKLSLGYQLIRSHEVYNTAVKQVTAEITKGAPDVHLYAGYRA